MKQNEGAKPLRTIIEGRVSLPLGRVMIVDSLGVTLGAGKAQVTPK